MRLGSHVSIPTCLWSHFGPGVVLGSEGPLGKLKIAEGKMTYCDQFWIKGKEKERYSHHATE